MSLTSLRLFMTDQNGLGQAIIGAAIMTIALTTAQYLQIKQFSKRHTLKASSLKGFLTTLENKFTDHQEQLSTIIKSIEKIGTDQSLNSAEVDGPVGKTIDQLQTKLTEIKEKERQRMWAAQGIASVSEIRKDNSDFADYSYRVISNLVKFLEANQGAFYRVTENAALELCSTYAYDRRKPTSEKIVLPSGTGLVGQCAISREMILMTDVPTDYIKITSGLGEGLPRCIVIVPLVFRDQVLGVIEMASFQRPEAYQLNFLTKACEAIALELSTIYAQEQTRKLLEQSREEELKQNLEEMKITQQKMVMKEEELNRQLLSTKRAIELAEAEQKKNEAILEGCMDAVISFNEKGVVEYFNKAAEETFGVNRANMLGHSVENFLNIRIEENEGGELKIMSSTGYEVSLRTEITAVDSTGEIVTLLLTATQVKLDRKSLFTLFAQKVSVDLF